MALSRKNKTPLLPSAAQDFITARVTDAKGGLLVASGLSLGTALLTFNPKDPSFNTVATDATVHNALGSTGAYISDMLLQTLGGASHLIAPALIVWGARILLRRELARLNLRTALLLTTTLCASITLARIPSDTGYLGGSLGALLLSSLGNDLQKWLGNAAFNAVAALAFLPAAAGYLYALGFSREEWKKTQEHLSLLNEHALRLVARFIPEREADAPVRRLRVSLQEDNNTEEREEITEARKRKPVVTPTKKAPAADKQRKLNFRANDDDWELPSVDLLTDRVNNTTTRTDESSLQKNALMLQSTLRDFGVEGDITKVSPGPIVTLYEMEPAPGTKTSRVIGLSDDIARSMSAVSVRVAVVPGKNAIGLELPNAKREMVFLKELISTREYDKTTAKLPLVLGKDIAGAPVIADLAKMPHLLVAGTTGSGKSVAVNTMILSLLYKLSPQQCRFIMIDPKMLELSAYDDIPHLLTPVVTEPHRAITALKWAVREMEDRYRAMSKLGVRNIDGFNERINDARAKGEVLMHKVQTGFDPDTGKPVFEEQPLPQTELPYIVIIVDEFADLMLVAGKEVENAIQRLAQMARAAGIHLIMATQRPSVDVITGIIKANFPTRISFQVTSKIDSRTILNDGGAEQLLGQGDMLYMAGGGRIQRVHGPFVADDEVEKIVKYLRSQGTPNYIEGVTVDEEEEGTFGDGQAGEGSESDALYDQAVAIIIRERKVSTSFIQRHLQIGYNRAARIVERMEREGLITPANHAGKREILGGGGNYGT